MPSEGYRPARPPAARSVHFFELLIFTAFISVIAFFAYDGFKEIFTKPVPFKPKEAEDSIAELKATIAKSKDQNPHKYVQAARGDRRSALQSIETASPPPFATQTVSEPTEPEKEPHYTKVIVVSAMQESPCLVDSGNELHYHSVLNKQDYARLHGYDFVLGIKQVDPQLENMWNKPAWLLKVLEDEERQGEWILWMDIDTVVIDANFTLPYEEYAAKSKDLILYGNVSQVHAGHPVQALNTGVMLVRNSPWSRHFFSEVNRLGRLDDHHKGKTTLSSILLKELQSDAYSDGLRDQNAVVYLLKTHPEWLDRVAFQDTELCLNCYWRDLIGVTGYGKPEYERTENVTFIQHFMGCQTCNALNRNGDLDSCRDAMFHSFSFVKAYQQPMLQVAAPRGEPEFAQLRELPYCSQHPDEEGCLGAKPLQTLNYARASPQLDWKKVDNQVVAQSAQNKTAEKSTEGGGGGGGGGGIPEEPQEAGRTQPELGGTVGAEIADIQSQDTGTATDLPKLQEERDVLAQKGASSSRKGERRDAKESQRQRARQRKRMRLNANRADSLEQN